MAQLVMADFMSDNCNDFILAHLLDQCIIEDDFSKFAKSSKKSIGMGRPFASIQHLNFFGLKARFFR